MGETLFRQGDPADSMYLVVRGRLQVWINAEPPVYVGEVTPGESVGEVGIITGEVRSADVVAVRSSILVKFPVRKTRCFYEEPLLGRADLAMVGSRLIQIRLLKDVFGCLVVAMSRWRVNCAHQRSSETVIGSTDLKLQVEI